jgi:hypothetical protein
LKIWHHKDVGAAYAQRGEQKGHDVIQAAARGNQNSTTVFHMNHPKNGIAVDAWRNQPNHNEYNTRIFNGLEAIKDKFETNDPDKLLSELNKFEDYLRNIINSNPNLHLNDIDFVYTP